MKPKIIKCSGSSSDLATQTCLAFSLAVFFLQNYQNSASCSLLTLSGQTMAFSPLSYIKLPASLPQVLRISLSSSVFSVLFKGTPTYPSISAFLYLCFPCPPSPALSIISCFQYFYYSIFTRMFSVHTSSLCVCVCL